LCNKKQKIYFTYQLILPSTVALHSRSNILGLPAFFGGVPAEKAVGLLLLALFSCEKQLNKRSNIPRNP
jgi:hypothetical protein